VTVNIVIKSQTAIFVAQVKRFSKNKCDITLSFILLVKVAQCHTQLNIGQLKLTL